MRESAFIFSAVHQPVVGKHPDAAFLVLFDFLDESVAEQGVIEMLEVLSIESIKSVRSAEPDVSILFLIYAVYCRWQSVAVRNPGVDVLLFGVERQNRAEQDEI